MCLKSEEDQQNLYQNDPVPLQGKAYLNILKITSHLQENTPHFH
jgi:hypothetical protein